MFERGPHLNWVFCSIDSMNRSDEDKAVLIRFWNNFYTEFDKKQIHSVNNETKSEQYKSKVFDKLEKAKNGQPLGPEELRKLQLEMEDEIFQFDEESIYKTLPNIIKNLIKINDQNAKDYLRSQIKQKDDNELLSEFGQYTIEALIVHVLSLVFNSLEYNSLVRVATLIERLESSVRTQAALLKHRRCKKDLTSSTGTDDVNKVNLSGKDREKKMITEYDPKYPFGSNLIEFMMQRGLITIINDQGDKITVRNKVGSYHLPKNVCAFCNFDISLLPIKLNLPMVYPPLDWTSACPDGQNPRYLSDLSGGYLSGPAGEIYDRYRLLSSGDINHFYIDIGQENNYDRLCQVMNKLQSQPFSINSDWLNYIQANEHLLVEYGYLMPRFLASMNIKDVSNSLRESHMKDDVIRQLCSFSELLHTLCKNIQRSRYEQLIIKLAKAYDGYQFYLPAFLDFRGRIYRCGILHFHERDLARSMIVFADKTSNDNVDMTSNYDDDQIISYNLTAYAAAAFHYKSFNSINDALNWFLSEKWVIWENPIGFAREAKRPFQFLSNLIAISKNSFLSHKITPITQDASASAYQIMSYFLLDEIMAKRTNLFPSPEDQIQDVYTMILKELKEYIQEEWCVEKKNLSSLVCNLLTRKIVKGIFMPIIYGKTVMSTASDLKDHLSHYITYKECFEVASLCFKFWRTKYLGMDCLIRLIRHIGWIASARGSPVIYKVPYFRTVQDYMKMEGIYIWIYNKLHKKRHRVTLRVSSSKRDRRKTEISTFVNFIHQRDAYIAMHAVEYMLLHDAPIYTVHDNFITTAEHSHKLPKIYSTVIRDMGPPLSIINELIYMNVIEPILKGTGDIPTNGLTKDSFAHMVIPKDLIFSYLKANVPAEKMSKKMRETWDERISGTLSSYENYIRNVCGNVQYSDHVKCWQAHEEKWEKFQLKLMKEEGSSYYCVHY
ncbi:hypothetical protein FNV43_RR08327 [Rhamnella rubrinervis]|uniref:DNA-directed RNA polymerase n=1 Tax=Rhamnella rubrinervis TaxID=2594499 RepID=A0A8K0HHE9_9ROSA|nr:hypothetical protein FNV43_RR08327 [Rhamnella rubrinervis]